MNNYDELRAATDHLLLDEAVSIKVRDFLALLDENKVLRETIRHAAPFVEAVLLMAEDRTPGLAWLADAAEALGDAS